MKKGAHSVSLISSLLMITMVTAGQAQPGGGRRGRGPQVVSPEVSADGKVTFRLVAPEANAVNLDSPDLGRLSSPTDFTKNEQGVWELVLGPFDSPGPIRYHFNVDGVTINDPMCRESSEANRTTFSLAFVPGTKFMELQDVPHGAVAEVTYYSKVLGRFRRLHVYTPPGYESGQNTYPVLYLLHGGSDSDDSWSTVGRANVILDNLIAEARVVPMIVVMPDGHTTRPGVTGGGSFEDEFAKDIRPAIEKSYRVYADSGHRAIAGLSMGGGQTRSIALADLDDYSHICVLSGGLVTPTDVENTDGFKEKVKFLFISCGGLENPDATRANQEALQEIGIDSEAYVSPDTAHEWRTWQRSLYQFAPLLFRD